MLGKCLGPKRGGGKRIKQVLRVLKNAPPRMGMERQQPRGHATSLITFRSKNCFKVESAVLKGRSLGRQDAGTLLKKILKTAKKE